MRRTFSGSLDAPSQGRVSRRVARGGAWEKKDMGRKLCRLFRKDEGQGLVEYSLIAALVAVAVVAALTLLGGGIQNTLNSVVAAL